MIFTRTVTDETQGRSGWEHEIRYKYSKDWGCSCIVASRPKMLTFQEMKKKNAHIPLFIDLITVWVPQLSQNVNVWCTHNKTSAAQDGRKCGLSKKKSENEKMWSPDK